MAKAVITLKIMPESIETDLDKIKGAAIKKITAYVGKTETRVEYEPVAFGLKSIKLIFVMDESLGSTHDLERDIETIIGVKSVDVSDVRRAVG